MMKTFEATMTREDPRTGTFKTFKKEFRAETLLEARRKANESTHFEMWVSFTGEIKEK